MDLDYGGYVNQGQAQLMTWLKEKLAANEWKEANELTKVLMLKISSRKDGSYLYLDIDNCPDKEIKEIDQLWLDRSSLFGFSTQKAIYNRENYQQFITKVGWYKGDSWLSYDDIFFWETAPKGHLPYFGWHFWQRVYAPSSSSHLSSSHKHYHQPHYHHAPHGHNSGGGAAGAAAMGAAALAAAPWLIGAAALGGAAYLIHQEVTKDERKRKERLEKEEAERKERQKRLEEENEVEKNIGTLLALV